MSDFIQFIIGPLTRLADDDARLRVHTPIRDDSASSISQTFVNRFQKSSRLFIFFIKTVLGNYFTEMTQK